MAGAEEPRMPQGSPVPPASTDERREPLGCVQGLALGLVYFGILTPVGHLAGNPHIREQPWWLRFLAMLIAYPVGVCIVRGLSRLFRRSGGAEPSSAPDRRRRLGFPGFVGPSAAPAAERDRSEASESVIMAEPLNVTLMALERKFWNASSSGSGPAVAVLLADGAWRLTFHQQTQV